jgi:aryl-alcohol dehydrogenase-like predicted oxidoreductase
LPSEYQYPGNDRRLAALKDVASGRGLQQGQIVLAWLTGGDPALTPIVGVSTPEQLAEAWIGVHTELEPDERQLLDSAF